mmetsp:Transcript_3142/g.4863  ORF Transcript_3142/g.4863 Transcript_3142/m.4863 type:complete len:622 (+) Transcript_3142:86-1951(+)
MADPALELGPSNGNRLRVSFGESPQVSDRAARRRSSPKDISQKRRSSFVYEQVSDKADPTHRIKRQFSKKGTVIVTTKVDCVIDRGRHVQVNDYHMLKSLGKGAYGEVKLAAKDLTEDDFGATHEKFAIKILKRNPAGDERRAFHMRRSSGGSDVLPPVSPELQSTSSNTSVAAEEITTNLSESLAQEIAILKILVHPNLVKLLEIINDENSKYVYLVLEHIEGGTVMVFDEAKGQYVYRLTKRVMLESTARKTFKDLISALSYLHANHIAHRDIKPDNLLVDFKGNLKLSDFGVSSHFESDRKKSAISLVALARSKSRGAVSQTEGTYSFYSPEMCTVKTGTGYSAYMADMWAASICLWIFVFGKVPFYHPEVMTLFQMIREEDPIKPHRVSPELEHLFDMLLQKDVGVRPSAAHVRHHCWLTGETLFEYLKSEEDSGDSSSSDYGEEDITVQVLDTLRADDIECEIENEEPKLPKYVENVIRKKAQEAKERCRMRHEEFVKNANIEMNLLLRKAQQRVHISLVEESEEESSLDDMSISSDDSDPLGRISSFIDDSTRGIGSTGAVAVLKMLSEPEDSDISPSKKHGSNKIRGRDDEDEYSDTSEDYEQSFLSKFCFCCS